MRKGIIGIDERLQSKLNRISFNIKAGKGHALGSLLASRSASYEVPIRR
jgi:hypothetical protein